MDYQEKSFNISVEINQGLEPLTFTIIPVDDASLSTEGALIFKVTRDKETLAILKFDQPHSWQQLEGKLDQNDVNAIGQAIDTHNG
ncbi:hypothetical protein AQ505_16045 [Pedobacter sp. PACM 27299]|uniref:hypothetical protein n=1 Tax=Pedobacter sp. PACM 27299 TaxID=1727164 RepID=UPI0007067DFD|nr:hypothetical protein [Pedobacter sp. PACM 27299]ALL06864.1 hypothetical protein AQ505_16045 [Pedobacter sp. PACM 27299]